MSAGVRRAPLARGFPPLAGRGASILVLGSLPGEKSLELGQYYARPENAFWSIMGALFGAGPALSYSARCRRLIAGGVAVWDVLAAGRRSGSLDSAIVPSSIVINDFATFFVRHPGIRRVLFNGRKAADLYRRRVLGTLPPRFAALDTVVLPSTSPAYASLRPAAKLDRWAAALGRPAGDAVEA